MTATTRSQAPRSATKQATASPAHTRALPSTPIQSARSHAASTPHGTSQSKTEQGLALITGVVVLENPRLPDPNHPRTLLLDGTFSLGKDKAPLCACFKYYNADPPLPFDTKPRGKYFICAAVSHPTEAAEICSTTTKWEDYDLIGDIIWIASAQGAEAQRQTPLLLLSGPVSHVEKGPDASCFDMAAPQYVQQLKGFGRVAAHITIPDSPRYRNGKPLPTGDSAYAVVNGSLKSVNRNSKLSAESFEVTLENVAYPSRGVPAIPVFNPATPPPAGQQFGRRLRFEDPDDELEMNPEKRPRYDALDGDHDGDNENNAGGSSASGLASPLHVSSQ